MRYGQQTQHSIKFTSYTSEELKEQDLQGEHLAIKNFKYVQQIDIRVSHTQQRRTGMLAGGGEVMFGTDFCKS